MNASTSNVATLSGQSSAGIYDIIEGFRSITLWTTLGWYDFMVRYRRTAVGPFWQTASVGIWVMGLTFVFGRLLSKTGENYMGYLASGLVIWNFISASLSGSTGVFVKNAKLIFCVNNPLYTYALRQVVENLLKAAFQSLAFVAVLPFTKVEFGPVQLMAIPGFIAIVFTALWLVPLMGMIGARYRDVSFALSSIMRFLFFTTPVFWLPSGLGRRAYLAHYNPLAHFLDVVRTPLLGHMPSRFSWIVVLTITLTGAVITLIAYNRFRRRVIFWL